MKMKLHQISELPSSSNQSSIKDNQIGPKSSNATNCHKTEILPGCEIVDRTCQCWQTTISVCRESSVTKWDFANVEVKILIFNGNFEFEIFYFTGMRIESAKSHQTRARVR